MSLKDVSAPGRRSRRASGALLELRARDFPEAPGLGRPGGGAGLFLGPPVVLRAAGASREPGAKNATDYAHASCVLSYTVYKIYMLCTRQL